MNVVFVVDIKTVNLGLFSSFILTTILSLHRRGCGLYFS